jgi:hypothetical protein
VDHFLMLICWALRDRDVRRHFAPLQERCQMMDWGQGRRPASEPPALNPRKRSLPYTILAPAPPA